MCHFAGVSKNSKPSTEKRGLPLKTAHVWNVAPFIAPFLYPLHYSIPFRHLLRIANIATNIEITVALDHVETQSRKPVVGVLDAMSTDAETRSATLPALV